MVPAAVTMTTVTRMTTATRNRVVFWADTLERETPSFISERTADFFPRVPPSTQKPHDTAMADDDSDS